MKTILIAFTIAFLPILSMSQVSDLHKNAQLMEFYEGKDTLAYVKSWKTTDFKVLDGRFDMLKNGKTIILGAYTDGLKSDVWMMLDEDGNPQDSIDYTIIHSISEKEYDEVVDYNIETGIIKEIKYGIGGFRKDRYPFIPYLKDSLGKVTIEFVVSKGEELTNLKVLDYTHEELISDALQRFCAKSFAKVYGIGYQDKNVRVQLPILIDIKKDVKLR